MDDDPVSKEAGETGLMSFWEHLDELRGRLIKSILFVCAGFLIAYLFVGRIQDFLIASFFSESKLPLAFLNPTEGFIVSLKLALAVGLLIAAPGVFYQFWRFVAPGLYPRERKFILPVVITSTVSFLVGVAFSFLMLPYATKFFLSFGGEKIQNLWSFGSYVDLMVRLMLAFGAVFELPLVIFFLVRLGIVTPEFLRKQRRYAIIINLIIAAVITPPDIFTMIVLSVPLLALYEVSILVGDVVYRKRLNPETSDGT
ncbi:MAG TPA: twin-arginine translocase subunit TatC [bacterium]|jgi:sec-independent protein translocase protein TatC